jgi:hypothetical protein
MSTQKKNPDPSEAGLSAIEQALGLSPNEAGAAGEASATKPGDKASPRLPRVDEAELFKVDPAVKSEGQTLEIKPPQRKKAEAPEPQADADFSASRPSTSLAEPATAEPRRGSILPANDDRRASVAELLEPLRRPQSKAAYLFAGLFAVLWIAGAWLLLSKPDGMFFAADGALRPGIELPLALAGIGVVLPVLFVFALAALHRRSRDLKNSARVMAEVAARLAEPEAVGADAVFTLGQAVRREVSSIGDGVERALTRATELESIVHGEVSALERSYADNEYKMRQLVTELAAEREAIMATADRIRNTIDAAHQGFSADIEKASESISKAIDEAGERVTVLINGKQDELVGTLDRSALHAGDLIRTRTGELSETLGRATAETSATLEGTNSTILSQLHSTRQSLLDELQRLNSETLNGLGEAGNLLTSRLAEQTEVTQREIFAASERVTDAMRLSSQALTADWENTTGAASRQLAETGEQTARLLRETQGALLSDIQSKTSEVGRNLVEAGANTVQMLRETQNTLVSEWDSTIGAATRHLAETSDQSARLLREAGETLKTEITDTADVVQSAFQSNSRTIIETIGQRAIEINETMRGASSDFITAMENRGIDTARLIEEKGGAVVERLTTRSDELAERMIGSATRIEESLGVSSRVIATTLEETSSRLDATLGQGTRDLEALLGGNAQKLADTFGANGLQIEATLARSIQRIEETLGKNSRAIETALDQHRDGFETAMSQRSEMLAGLIGARVEQANEAFSIAAESLGALIFDRTRSASAGLKAEMDELGVELARQSSQATERLAGAGRDVLQALNQHGAKVNDALMQNAQRLAETVSERTSGLGEKFAQFEKTFLEKADQLENVVVTQGDVLGSRIAERTQTVAGQLESLLNRVEGGVDERTRAINDMVALRTLELTRVLNENGGSLLGNLEKKVQNFHEMIVLPLDQHAQTIEQRGKAAAEAIANRLDQTSEAILLRAGEVERNLTALSRDVGQELIGRAAEVSNLLDQKGANFASEFSDQGRAMVAQLETASGEIARRVTSSLAELNAAIQSGSATSLNQLVDANDRLKGEVAMLLDKLGDANRVLNTIVGQTSHNLAEIESKVTERVQGLEATLAAILSAANQGSDALAARVEAIRGASGELLTNSQAAANTLAERTTAMQALTGELTGTQARLATVLAERQGAFETLAQTLNSRIEDVDAMLRSFTSLVEDQLAAAQAGAREASALVHQSAESAATAISSQYERIRLESGKERERTAAALRAAYEQANGEMNGVFQRSLDHFNVTAGELRQATREILADLEATRAALQSGGLEIPQAAREASSQLKRVVGDQIRALNELQDLVARSGPALDVAEPRRSEPVESARSSSLGLRPAFEQPARQPAPSRNAAPNPPARGGGSWLSGLLERASDDEPTPAPRSMRSEPASARRIESLDSLSVDIARMIDHEAAIELWDRYRRGERNVFTRKLYTLQGQEAYDDIRRRYRRDADFKRTVDAYVDQFERLLAEVAGDDRDSLVARTYLTSDTGKVYTMLAHAAGRFD